MKRVTITVEQIRILIRIGAFRFTSRSKKQLLWDVHAILGRKIKTEVSNELFEIEKNNIELPLLYSHKLDDAFDEREILGFSLCPPFDLMACPPETKMLSTDFIFNKDKIVDIVGYLVTSKHTRTKHNERMMFGTFIDYKGNFFDTTHFPKIYNEFPIRGRGCYLIKGKVAEEFGFYSLDVMSILLVENYSRETV